LARIISSDLRRAAKQSRLSGLEQVQHGAGCVPVRLVVAYRRPCFPSLGAAEAGGVESPPVVCCSRGSVAGEALPGSVTIGFVDGTNEMALVAFLIFLIDIAVFLTFGRWRECSRQRSDDGS